jgi:transposase InsO family protein
VKFAFILAQKALYPITLLCTVLSVSTSGFYAWRTRPRTPSARARADEQLGVEIAAVHARSRRTYGSPRVFASLRAQGQRVGKKRVERLMRQRGLRGERKRPFRTTTDSRHADPIAPNRLARDFTATAPNRVWVTDVTAVRTREGWLFVAAMVDLFARRVVGWAMSETNDTALALAALERAVRARKPPPGLVHHSDRGSPYASGQYRAALAAHGMVASMSRKGDCWDNAVAESFFSTLKAELTERTNYATREEARRSIGEYIDGFYNVERRHSFNGYLNPTEYELRCHVKRVTP